MYDIAENTNKLKKHLSTIKEKGSNSCGLYGSAF